MKIRGHMAIDNRALQTLSYRIIEDYKRTINNKMTLT